MDILANYPAFWRRPAPIPWDAFKVELLAQYEPPMRAKSTATMMRALCGHLDALVGADATTAALTPDLIARFIASRPASLSPNTIRAELGRLSAVCSYAESRSYLDVSPFRFRRQWIRPAPQKRKQHHARADIAKVLAQAAREVARKTGWAQWRARRAECLIAVVAYCGLRKNEALYLKVEDVDLKNGVLMIVARDENKLKTVGSAQPVPVPAELAKVLADWMPRTMSEWLFPNCTHARPWTGGSPGYRPLDRLKRIAKRAGIEGMTFLSLRHSWASHAESAWGLSELTVQRVLRHSTPRTQAHYRHADLPNLRAKCEGISFGPTEGERHGQ